MLWPNIDTQKKVLVSLGLLPSPSPRQYSIPLTLHPFHLSLPLLSSIHDSLIDIPQMSATHSPQHEQADRPKKKTCREFGTCVPTNAICLCTFDFFLASRLITCTTFSSPSRCTFLLGNIAANFPNKYLGNCVLLVGLLLGDYTHFCMC